MKILIFYASYGGGHLNAAKAILEYLTTQSNSNNNLDIEMIDCMKYINKPVEIVTTTAYREMAKKLPWAWGKIYSDSQKGPLAHISTRANKIMAIKLLRLLREKKPDLIISTHPFGSQMCSYLKRKKKITAKIATIMTDFAPHDQWLVGSDFTDYYFVAHDGMKKDLISKNIPSERIFATGIPISKKFLEPHDKQKILKDFNLSENKNTILFFGGGEFGLGKTKTFSIFKTFVQKCSNMQIIAIAGKNEKMKNMFNEIIHSLNAENYVHVIGFTDQISDLMSISQLVVTKPGGMTTTECLVSKLPMVIINPIPGQEEKNAELLEKKGVAIWIKKASSTSAVISQLFSTPNKLNEMKDNTNSLSKPNSTKDICDILLNLKD